MNKSPLFRPEVMHAKKNQYYGVVSINTPMSYVTLTLGSIILMIFVILFIILGKYSEKTVVRGYLNSTQGIVRVYPKKSGVILKQWIHEGDVVKKGTPLFLIDTSYEGQPPMDTDIFLTQLNARKKRIEKEIRYKRAHVLALKKLFDHHYISEADYHTQQEALTVLENNKNEATMAIIKHKEERSYLIVSSVSGVVSSLIYHPGQYVNASKLLLKIMPKNATLVAELFVPVKQSRFLEGQHQITVHYDAYPYVHFGSAEAAFKHISQSMLTDNEEDKPFPIGEPYYKATATLAQSFITIHGDKKTLQQGMTLSAVIMGSKRNIWQWIFDPFHAFYRELAS